jgi:hypothetical protein
MNIIFTKDNLKCKEPIKVQYTRIVEKPIIVIPKNVLYAKNRIKSRN